jgi:heme exporter protein A
VRRDLNESSDFWGKAGSSGRPDGGPGGAIAPKRGLTARGYAVGNNDLAGEKERLPRRVAGDIRDYVSRDQTSESCQLSLLESAPPRTAYDPVAVEARDLACVRGETLVFSGLSFRVPAGTLLVVTGPNGSGKSSLLRIVAGLIRPEAGSLGIEGAGGEVGLVHYLGHADALKPALSLAETLSFWAALYGGEKRALAGAAGRVGLGHALRLPVAVLSAGQRRRAGLARLLVAPRPLWLLDEPGAALDRDGEALLGRLMAEHLGAGGTIIAATHQDLPVTPDSLLDLGRAA